MENGTLIQALLEKQLLEFKKRNPQFSNRAYAKKLGLSSGALTDILNGNRNITRLIAERIVGRLRLDPMERANVLRGFSEVKKKRMPAEETRYLKLSSDHFKLMSEWYYFAILSLMKTADFKNDPFWISERLGISLSTTQKSIECMIRLKVLKVEKDGTWVRSEAGYRTEDDITDLSIQKAHLQTLELSKDAIDQYSVQERDFTSLTLPLDFEDLPEVKRLIRKFQTELYEHFNLTKKSKEVFRMAVQVFPLSKPISQKKPRRSP